MLEAVGLHKSFGTTHAARNVSFAAHPGRVLALVGENGSGKSTIMRMVASELAPDEGSVLWNGQRLSTNDALLVHQELAICPHLTAGENMFLGTIRGFGNNPKRLAQLARTILEDLGFHDIDPAKTAERLSVSQRQVIEIARSVVRDAPIILLDEPTSSLSETDKAKLYALIRRLKGAGKTILFISHFLEEIREVSDDALILRDGEAVIQAPIESLSNDDIVRHMVGRDITELFPRSARTVGDPILSLTDLTGQAGKPVHINLELRRGEVLGIAGLNGAGRTELLRTIMHLRAKQSGSCKVGAYSPKSIREMWRHGVGFVSEERKIDGLATDLSVGENLTMPTRVGIFNKPRQESEHAHHWIRELGVACQHPDQKLSSLSGGNQQKVALARLLHARCDIFLLDEPTRGIDIASKAEIYRQIDHAAKEGAAILMASSYLPELLGTCDRIAVMRQGELVRIFDAHAVTSEQLIMECVR